MIFVNVTLNAYSILVGLILFISICSRRILNDKYKSWFKIMVLANMLVAASDIVTLIFDGPANPINFKILPFAMFVFYLMSYLTVISVGVEIIYFINQEKFRKAFIIILISVSALYLSLLTLTPVTGFFYTIDENNVYSRGPYFFTAIIIQAIIYINLLFYLILNRKAISSIKIAVILTFMLFPQIMQIIQIAFYGVSLITTGYTVAFLAMFIQSNRALELNLDYASSELDEKEFELNEKEFELNEKVSEIERSKIQVIKMQNHTIESLSNLVENRDEDTGEHVRRTRAYVELLAVQLMKNNHYPDVLTPRYVRFLKRAAPMHDIGKIVVPDAILKKPARLTEAEFERMKEHAVEGGRIVHEILDGYEDPEYIKITADIATHHHEKWDGSGYPGHLAGEAIPLCARIMAIADVFDALVSPRVYKSPMSYDEAFRIIEEESGIHFDPVVAQEFLNIKEKAAAINESMKVRP